MSIESEVFAALRSLVADKVYPDVNDAGTDAPYIVHTRAGGVAPTFLERATPSKENTRLRVTSWETTRIAANALAKQVHDALVALTTIDVKPIGTLVALYDEDTKLRGATQDFSVWADH